MQRWVSLEVGISHTPMSPVFLMGVICGPYGFDAATLTALKVAAAGRRSAAPDPSCEGLS